MNLNPIDFDYIDGKNTYPLQDYIDEKISNNNIYINNNLFSSNVNLNNNQKLDNSLYFSGSNLYLKNNNCNGEIRFSTKVNYPLDSNINYGTKITDYGKLEVYHNYNLLQPLYSAGWYNVSDELLQLKADGINTDAQFTLIEASIVYLKDQNTGIIDKIIDLEAFKKVMTNAYGQADTYEAFQSVLFSGNSPIARAATRQAYQLIQIQSQQAYQNSIAIGAVYGVGFAIGGAVLGYIGSKFEQDRASNALYNNSNLTDADKNEIYNSNILSNVSNISNFNIETSNLGLFNGFLNSNTITQQYLNSIKTNQITLNNLNISNVFVNSNILTTQNIPSINTNQISLSNLNFSNIFTTSNVASNTSNSLYNYTSNSLFTSNIPIYANSNAVKDIIVLDTPRVNKKSAFYCTTTNIIYPNGGNTAYYCYHIDLRNYTQTGYIQIGSQSGDPYRVFKIRCFFGSCYFQRLVNGVPDVIEYTIYQSYKANSGGTNTKQGLNFLAIGTPNSPFLDTITPNSMFLLRNAFNDFNYISIVTTALSDIRVFVEDLLA